MFKCYVKINGMWVQVYRLHGWYDLFCWFCAVGLCTTIGILAWRNML